ncbi:hypothetical protein H0X48_03380 [Candidatus Dependentiae bacterium]|nr:hypothetical protein [Candidatus Dependentiae bacterium]
MKNSNKAIEGISLILARHKLVPMDELQALMHTYKSSDDIAFEDFLIEEDLVTKDDLLQAMSEYYSVPALDVVGEFFDHYLLSLFPKNILLRFAFIPYTRQADILTIVAAEPDYPELARIISQFITHDLAFMVGLNNDIIESVNEFYDESITYQPNHIANAQMERSAGSVHPMDLSGDDLLEDQQPCLLDENIPCIIEENDDDYETF